MSSKKNYPLPGAVAVVVAGDLPVGRELVQLKGKSRGQLGGLVSLRTRGAESEMRMTEMMDTQTHGGQSGTTNTVKLEKLDNKNWDFVPT